jgi:hypothetical protein
MPKYLCLQRNLPGAASGGEKPSPAQMQEIYAQFAAWQAKFKNHLTDMGGRLGSGRLVTTDAPKDGPFIEVKELIGGYMVVTAANLDEAIAVATGCPGLMRPGSGVEVIEIIGGG